MIELRKVNLGRTGLQVTQLCFGTLTLSALQADLPVQEGGRLIRRALDGGINFIDTAQGYKNYAHVKAGISGVDRSQLVIATKSHARTIAEMQAAFDQARSELGVEYLDIFLLHLVKSADDFSERRKALDLLLKLKAGGLIRAVGISCHNITPLRCAIGNSAIDICHMIFNRNGLGIKDGSISEMLDVVDKLHAEGKGIYAMKPLGGGLLVRNPVEALRFVKKQEAVHAVAIGMKDERELAFNLAFFRGEPVTDAISSGAAAVPRRLFINWMCNKCGACAKICEQEALSIGNERMEVDAKRCILCGYCIPECHQFAIRII